jgi:hypothetical protein
MCQLSPSFPIKFSRLFALLLLCPTNYPHKQDNKLFFFFFCLRSYEIIFLMQSPLPVKCRITDPFPGLRSNSLLEPILDFCERDIKIFCQQPTLIHFALKDPVSLDHYKLGLATVVG